MMQKETAFLNYYRSIESWSKPSNQAARSFKGYELSQTEVNTLIQGLDNFREIYSVLYAISTEDLIINSPEFLSKLIERVSIHGVGWNCLNMAIKYYGLEQTLLQLYKYIKKESFNEVLDGFFEPIARHTLLFHVWNAANNFTPIYTKENALSSDSALLFVELLINLFLQENRFDYIYGYHLSKLICIQDKYFPKSLYYLLPDIINRANELKQKTNIEFYNFDYVLSMNK